MGESHCIVISIYYWVGPLCVCLCVDLLKSIMCLRVCTVYAHRLTFTVPRPLSSIRLPLSPLFSLTLSFSVFIPLYALSFIHPFIYHPPPACLSFSLPLQCIGHISTLLLQRQPSLQQPALKLMAESGDERLLKLTLDQINSMTPVSGDVKVWVVQPGPESPLHGSQ